MAEGEENKKYGKRPLWQWVALYVVIGGIIYAVLYFSGVIKFGNYSRNSSTQGQSQYSK